MTLYAPLALDNVKVEVGGCGERHSAKKGERLSVSCGPCESVIGKRFAGWAGSPQGATLTEAEEAQREEDKAARDQMFTAAGASLGELINQQAAQVKRTRKATP